MLVLVIKDKSHASEYVFASLVTFYLGYIGYVLVPVVGPGYTVHFAAHVGDIAPQFTTNTRTIARDCFPSLHTALSVLMTIYIWRYRPRLGVVYTILTGLIIVATVYLRFHYLLDDLAGLTLAFAVSWAAPGVFGLWERIRRPKSPETSSVWPVPAE